MIHSNVQQLHQTPSVLAYIYKFKTETNINSPNYEYMHSGSYQHTS